MRKNARWIWNATVVALVAVICAACNAGDTSTKIKCNGGVFDGDSYGPYRINNPSDLARLSGYAKMQGDLSITNLNITNLSVLQCLSYVAGYMSIHSDNSLATLSGLDSLTGVGWSFVISGNDRLTNVDAFINLTTVGMAADTAGHQPGTGWLAISDNRSLLNLNGLANLKYLDGNLEITGNSKLPTCAAVALKTQLEKAGWKRTATICGNLADECGSEACPTQDGGL